MFCCVEWMLLHVRDDDTTNTERYAIPYHDVSEETFPKHIPPKSLTYPFPCNNLEYNLSFQKLLCFALVMGKFQGIICILSQANKLLLSRTYGTVFRFDIWLLVQQ